MKKKTYIKPEISITFFRGPVLMIGGSKELHQFINGGDIIIGDPDD